MIGLLVSEVLLVQHHLPTPHWLHVIARQILRRLEHFFCMEADYCRHNTDQQPA
jgi:hypothetical protein